MVDGAFRHSQSDSCVGNQGILLHNNLWQPDRRWVYESLFDGMELEELREHSIRCQTLLMVDAYDTWWNMGRSYLCRIVDMLHMGYVDEGYSVRKFSKGSNHRQRVGGACEGSRQARKVTVALCRASLLTAARGVFTRKEA